MGIDQVELLDGAGDGLCLAASKPTDESVRQLIRDTRFMAGVLVCGTE
ncbi:MAG TPA: hypothetical protein VMF03_13010 [Steroidobacteraceae bacterium]|nr:hypothetical protein [Steroidobacteraceae bacterium]